MAFPRGSQYNRNSMEIWWRGLLLIVLFLHVLILYNFTSFPPQFIPSISVNSKPFSQIADQLESASDKNDNKEELIAQLKLQLLQKQQLCDEREVEIEKYKTNNYNFQKESDKIVNNLLGKQQLIASAVKYQNALTAKSIQIPTTIKYTHKNYKKNEGLKKLNIVTFNVWNTNGEWRDRLIEFAKQIKDMEVDIIGFQEVRTVETPGKRASALPHYQLFQFPSSSASDYRIEGTVLYDQTYSSKYPENQLTFIQSLLPDYPYLVFVPLTTFQSSQQEGIALISKYPITKANVINISNGNKGQGYSDTNNRGVLHTTISVSNPAIHERNFTVDIYNTHLPYVEVQQCNSAIQVFDYLTRQPSASLTVLLGDMNTYFDYEWPMEIFTQPFNWLQLSGTNPCSSEISNWLFTHPSFDLKDKVVFNDVWDVHIKRDQQGKMILGRGESEFDGVGHTFPSFQPPSGMLNNCRPDRVLYYDYPLDFVHFDQIKVFLFGGEFERSQFVSDHAGILTSFYTS